MVTVQDLVDSSSRDDLVDQADELGIGDKREDGSKKSKAELAEDILEAEGEEPDYEPDEVEESPEPAVEEAVEEVREAEVDADEDADDVEAGSGDDILVRFVGKNPTLQTSGFAFKRDNPFKVMSESDADRLFESRDGDKFRVATPKEAKEFYS